MHRDDVDERVGSEAKTVRVVTIVHVPPVGRTGVQSLEVDSGVRGVEQIARQGVDDRPVDQGRRIAELSLVTTIVQVTTPPTTTGSGEQSLVTLTPGWNSSVVALAVAVSDEPRPE